MQPMKPFTLVSGGLSGLPEIPIVPAKEGQPNPGAPFLAKIDRGSEIFLYGNAKQLMKGIWHTLRGLLGAVGYVSTLGGLFGRYKIQPIKNLFSELKEVPSDLVGAIPVVGGHAVAKTNRAAYKEFWKLALQNSTPEMISQKILKLRLLKDRAPETFLPKQQFQLDAYEELWVDKTDLKNIVDWLATTDLTSSAAKQGLAKVRNALKERTFLHRPPEYVGKIITTLQKADSPVLQELGQQIKKSGNRSRGV